MRPSTDHRPLITLYLSISQPVCLDLADHANAKEEAILNSDPRWPPSVPCYQMSFKTYTFRIFFYFFPFSYSCFHQSCQGK